MNFIRVKSCFYSFLKVSAYLLIALCLTGLIYCGDDSEDKKTVDDGCTFPTGPHWLVASMRGWSSTDNGQTWCRGGLVSGDLYDMATNGTGHWVTMMTEMSKLVISYSANGGKDWSVSTENSLGLDDYPHGIGYGNGRWIIVGASAYYSDDGTNSWTEATTVPSVNRGSTIFGDVAYGNSKWVWVSQFSTASESIAYSSNGIDWTVATDSSATPLYSVAYNGTDQWVAVGDSAVIAYSTNGENWFYVATGGDTNDLYGVAYGGGRWVAVGEFGRIRTSTNGTAWDDVSPSPQTTTFRAVGYDGNGHWVAVGLLGIAYTSTDGITWTQYNITPNEPTPLNIYNIGFGN